jgi:signal transduction histidine kinase
VVFGVVIGFSASYVVIPSGLIWIAIAYFAIRDFQLRNMIIFLSTRNVKESMVSQNKALEESHANEMRHLIANVAHDLKTVSLLMIYLFFFY